MQRKEVKMKLYKAFTLAEIMIVLVIIGVLTAILLPVAIHSAPDENIMKFKKGNNTLGTVIRELVNSDKYYLNGDLGIKADGTRILSSLGFGELTTSDESLIKYFCTSFADILTTKKVDCKTTVTGGDDRFTFVAISNEDEIIYPWQSTMEEGKKLFDTKCAEAASKVGAEIETVDGIYWYQANPAATFGISWDIADTFLFHGYNKQNNLFFYKLFCMDVDGIDKGEDPFGYGIRVDGKILTGARADEWLKKSIQKED